MAFAPSHIKKHNVHVGKVSLNLTSMMDMFTIILVFLLKSYTTEGQLIQTSDHLELPKSSVAKVPEVALDIIVTRKEILVNDRPVLIDKNPAPNSMVADDFNQVITPLFNTLSLYAREAKKMEELYGTKFTGKVSIQGDYRLPFKLLVKVMYTCGQAEYGNMRLVAYRKNDL
ncbi:biopolymer transporter ExbD [candidate division KSB1 bacterium]|nr:biopolymer transporter ExbD [candidate division KSB1 bacterium]